MKDLCFIDVETTGTLFGFHEIINVGIVRTDNSGKKILNEFESRVVPQHPKRITYFAQKINDLKLDYHWCRFRRANPIKISGLITRPAIDYKKAGRAFALPALIM